MKLITALVTLVGMIFSGITFFASAADVEQLKTETGRAIKAQGYDNQISINDLRKQQLEDKIFEIELIPASKRSPVDSARLEKYQRDLREVVQGQEGLRQRRALVQ